MREKKAAGLKWQRLREDRKMEQEEAADALGISRATLSRYENGHQNIPLTVEQAMERLYNKVATRDETGSSEAFELGIAVGEARQTLRLLALAVECQNKIIEQLSAVSKPSKSGSLTIRRALSPEQLRERAERRLDEEEGRDDRVG